MNTYPNQVSQKAQYLTLEQVSCIVKLLEYLEELKVWDEKDIQNALFAFCKKQTKHFNFVSEAISICFFSNMYDLQQVAEKLSKLDKVFVSLQLKKIINVNTERLDPMFSSLL